MKLRIYRDVPMPENRGRVPRYPYGELEVGEMFEVEGAELAGRVRDSAKAWGRRHGARFSVRQIGEGLYGCWRVE